MSLFRPRTRKVFLRILKDLKLSDAVKSIIADIGVELDLIAYDAVRELRADVLSTLRLVESDLQEHDTEYQHTTSPELKEAVQRCIKKLTQGVPK